MNTADPSDIDEAGRIRDADADGEFVAASGAFATYMREIARSSDPATRLASERLRSLQILAPNGGAGLRFRRVFNGKGAPRDIALVLGLLHLSGRMDGLYPSVPPGIALQRYSDRFIGVDCSGFVNNYMTAIGRRADTLTDRPTIAMYASQGRRLGVISGPPLNHLFCWVSGESRTSVLPSAAIGFAHILVIDEWVLPPALGNDPVGARFRATQSSASLGGITTGVYEILSKPSAGARSFTWRIQRVAGMGDNTIEPATAVWNDVFLAPPF